MEDNIKECGKMENNMEEENIYLQMEFFIILLYFIK